MKDHEQVRKSVSRAYARAVSKPSGCCASSAPEQKGVAAKLAGYTRDELEVLPDEAVVNSFGCGNPLAFSEVEKGDVVLDLGSGAGIDLLIAARETGPAGRVIGVDMTDEMLSKARTVIEESGMTHIELRKGLIEELPVESGSVDWVISNCVINLSPEKEKVFAEIFRVLKPGGRMLVSDIIAENLPEQARDNLELYCSCIAGAISESSYCAGLEEAGLVDFEIRERIEYDTAQIQGVIESDQGAFKRGSECCNDGEASVHSIIDLAATCGGRVWSAKIFARKPS